MLLFVRVKKICMKKYYVFGVRRKYKEKLLEARKKKKECLLVLNIEKQLVHFYEISTTLFPMKFYAIQSKTDKIWQC